jgi:tetratricopeptide (TPR) repeat protein
MGLLTAPAFAQFSAVPGFSVTGELRSHDDASSNDFLIEIYDTRTNALIEREPVSHGQFQLDHVPVGSFSVRLLAAPGTAPLIEEFHEFQPGGAPLVLELPDRSANKPISGLVSVHDLQHPIPKKAIKEAFEAGQLAKANDLPKAITKLEDAIRIAPQFRDAHLNLGVEYARSGRTVDARAEFDKALEIGPPAAPIYADLALLCAATKQLAEAEKFARKALELDPANTTGKRVLEYALTH